MVNRALQLRDLLFGDRRDIRTLYVAAGVLVFLLITTLITLDRMMTITLWPRQSLLLVYGGTTVLALAGAIAGYLRAGILASWVITTAPLFALFAQILLDGVILRNPDRLTALSLAAAYGAIGGLTIGTLSYAIGRGIRYVR